MAGVGALLVYRRGCWRPTSYGQLVSSCLLPGWPPAASEVSPSCRVAALQPLASWRAAASRPPLRPDATARLTQESPSYLTGSTHLPPIYRLVTAQQRSATARPPPNWLPDQLPAPTTAQLLSSIAELVQLPPIPPKYRRATAPNYFTAACPPGSARRQAPARARSRRQTFASASRSRVVLTAAPSCPQLLTYCQATPPSRPLFSPAAPSSNPDAAQTARPAIQFLVVSAKLQI